MNLTQKKKDSLKDLQDTFSLYEARIKELERECKVHENKLQRSQEENSKLRHKVESLESSTVSLAHEYGMSSRDEVYHNAYLFLERNLREYRSYQEKCSDLGYSSLDNLFKAVKMMAPRAKKGKNRAYYEAHLLPELTFLPIGLELTSKAGEEKAIEKYLVESVYPVFETYLESQHTDNDRLIECWEEVDNFDDLHSLRNWCIERIRGIKEELPDDKIPLEALAKDCINLSSSFNEGIRKALAEWVSIEKISVTRLEYDYFWEGMPYDKVVRKLLTRYAGCELSPYVREALKSEGYNSCTGDWKEELTLEQLAAAMQAVEAIKETAEWSTDFISAATSSLRTWGKDSEGTSFTPSITNYNVSD